MELLRTFGNGPPKPRLVLGFRPHSLPLSIHTFGAEHASQLSVSRLTGDGNGLMLLEDVDPGQLVVRPRAAFERAFSGVLRLQIAIELFAVGLERHLS